MSASRLRSRTLLIVFWFALGLAGAFAALTALSAEAADKAAVSLLASARGGGGSLPMAVLRCFAWPCLSAAAASQRGRAPWLALPLLAAKGFDAACSLGIYTAVFGLKGAALAASAIGAEQLCGIAAVISAADALFESRAFGFAPERAQQALELAKLIAAGGAALAAEEWLSPACIRAALTLF